MRINVFNPETTHWEKSYLANPYSVGVTSIIVKNADRFAANDRIMIGEMGTETAEVVTASAVNADNLTLTVGTTLYAHSADDPVYVMSFDQVRFYRSTDSGSTYSLLVTKNMDVDNLSLQTIYDDTQGTSAYYYKTSFYHSVSTLESAQSDPIKATGWRREQVGNIIDEILKEVGDPQEVHVTRREYLGYFNDVNDDLQANVARPYTFLHSRSAHTRTINLNYLAFPTDSNSKQSMWKFDRLDYNFTDTSTDPDTDETSTIKVIPMEEFRNKYADNTVSSTTVSDDKPVAMTLDTSVNRFRFSHPAKTTGSNVFYLHYWKYFTTIDSEGDVIETPSPYIYKLYCKAMYWGKRAIADPTIVHGDRYLGLYEREKARYKTIDRKDAGTPRSFRPQDSTITKFRR